jgi:DNA-binding MarR family transcriptional regulator
VARLLAAGRLRRAVSRDDRRRSVLSVSAAGAAVYRAVAPLALGYEGNLLASLDAQERAALDRALDVLTARAQELSSAPATPDPARRRATGGRSRPAR